MAAPKNNKFWMLRSKHGRSKLFKSPKLLWEAACEYFEWCERNPLIEVDFVGPQARKVKKPKMRALTMQGLCIYLNCNTAYFDNFKATLEGKEDKVSQDFSSIIQLIKDTIYTQKFTGAAAGFLNSNLIARELKITDRSELTGKDGAPIEQKFDITLNLNK